MPIRAVFFDVGDTLWHAKDAPPTSEFRRIAAERVSRTLALWGLSHPDPGALARAAWSSLEDAMARARATDLVEPDYGEVACRALADLGLKLGRDRAAELLEAIYVSGSEGGKVAYPDAASTLQELRSRGFKLATLTNRAFGGRRFREDLVEAGLDPGWDAHAISVEVGYLKPHRAIFDYALDALKMKPHEALMVGNSLREDVAGAARVGLATAWRRSQPDADGVEPDFAFDELAELLMEPRLQECE